MYYPIDNPIDSTLQKQLSSTLGQPYHPERSASSTAMTPIKPAKSPAEKGRSILEYYTQTMPLSAACQSVQKRCTVVGCTKISVSRGLCRGHGGGRRCHFKDGCTKSAQSRSMFCWAHGGGQRCEVPQCMRSRKSKRFCVAHVHLENEQAVAIATAAKEPPRQRKAVKNIEERPPLRAVLDGSVQPSLMDSQDKPRRRLPSIRQALQEASRTRPNLPRRALLGFCA